MTALALAAVVCFAGQPQLQAQANLTVFYAVGQRPRELEKHVKGGISPAVSWRLKKDWGLAAYLGGEGDFFSQGNERYRFRQDGWILLEPIYVETCVPLLGPQRRLDDLMPAFKQEENLEERDLEGQDGQAQPRGGGGKEG